MLEITLLTLFSSFAVMAMSLVGALFTWKFLADWFMPRLRYLIALAAGVFTIIIYNLVEESLHEGLSLEVVIAFILGIVLLEVMTRLLPKNSHHLHEPCHEHTHTTIDARRMLVVDAFHNIHDGLALAPAFFVSPVVGFGTTLGILLHELVQEISEFFILKEAGYSTKKALSLNFLVSATILIGVGITLLLASFAHLGNALVAFSAGGFLYVLFRDLVPSIYSYMCIEKKYTYFILAYAIGLLCMISITTLLPHAHDPADDLELPEGFGLATR